MANSMTGFGRCRTTSAGFDITVEIKSVNNRFFDCSVRISRIWNYLEPRIKPFLSEWGIDRGKVDVSVTVESIGASETSLTLNESYASSYIDALRLLHDKFHLKNDITVMSVAQNRDLFITTKSEEDAEASWLLLKPVLQQALTQFRDSRAAEGQRLVADVLQKLDGIKTLLSEIASLSENDKNTYRERLAERIRLALQDNTISVDESRLLTECAIYADKIAIDEELVRLQSHFDAFLQITQDGKPVGRRLDFLMQEMNRETNTIGSKCIHADIAHIVVNIKNEFEKIREQIQNLE